MKTYKINELFYSIQGEGFHTGRPAIFVRFAGCNLSCDFCDTRHNEYFELTAEQIVEFAENTGCLFIVFTGGEPALQLDTSLLAEFKARGYYTAIETNGMIRLDNKVAALLNWITVSPKWGQKGFELNHREANEVKLVYTGSEEPMLEALRQTAAEYYYLQPCSMKNIPETVRVVLENYEWRLSFQVQKAIGVR